MNRIARYFPSGTEQIFGIFHPALEDREVREGVLICPPAPFETRRSHRALRNLAHNLAKRGYNVLRMDYRGTGDSSGDFTSWSLDAWKQDIEAAAAELRSRYGVERLSVVGLRLGAGLAWQALQGKSIKRFLLWDPIFDGAQYFRELNATHQHLVDRESDRAPFAAAQPRQQCLGFALNDEWISELNAYRLELPANARGVIVGSQEITDHATGNFKKILVAEDHQWSNALVIQLQSYAHLSITAIEQAIEGKA